MPLPPKPRIDLSTRLLSIRQRAPRALPDVFFYLTPSQEIAYPMLRKGRNKVESPEKMPVITTGIEMMRGARKQENPNAKEYLTGGNGVADETGVRNLVMNFIRRIKMD